MNKTNFILAITLAFVAGLLAHKYIGKKAFAANEEPAKPAYMLISVNEIHPDKMGPYKKSVGPVAAKFGGIELLAVAPLNKIQVMEGEWEKPGLLVLEKFESMDALQQFWHSDEYKEVKKLREGHAEVNFFIAVEGMAKK